MLSRLQKHPSCFTASTAWDPGTNTYPYHPPYRRLSVAEPGQDRAHKILSANRELDNWNRHLHLVLGIGNTERPSQPKRALVTQLVLDGLPIASGVSLDPGEEVIPSTFHAPPSSDRLDSRALGPLSEASRLELKKGREKGRDRTTTGNRAYWAATKELANYQGAPGQDSDLYVMSALETGIVEWVSGFLEADAIRLSAPGPRGHP